MSLIDSASLIVTPNGYKEGKLYSVIPSDGSGDMSVVRATTATRVNSAGLVELVPYNLLTYSEQLSNWTNIQFVTVTDNVETAPNGTLTASRINETAVTNVHRLFLNPTVSANKHTYSVYLKAGTRNWAFLRLDGLLIEQRTWFDIQNGTIGTTSGDHTATIEDAGNGWYRCSVSIAGTTYDTTPLAIIGLATANGVSNYAGDVNEYIYAWGAQLVEGTNALPYQKTETRLNIPRLDYSNGTCPSLLVEPQRTNLLTYSSSFDNAAWSVQDNVSVTANVAIAPDGTMTADKLVENSANTQHRIYRPINGTSQTISVFAKANGRNYIGLFSNAGTRTYFNLSDGTIGTVSIGSTATIEDYGNGWYRCTLYNAHISFGAMIQLSDNGINDSYLGDGTSGVFIWGAQLEAGNYQTSYIPTTSASVTRNADVISKTGISSLIGQTEGTVFADFTYNGAANTGIFETIFSVATNVSNEISIIKKNTTSELYVFVRNGGVIQINSGGISSTNIIGTHKVALAYKLNDYALYLDGVQVYTNTSATVPTCSGVFVGQAVNLLQQLGGGIKAAALWQTRLTNTELATLTTI